MEKMKEKLLQTGDGIKQTCSVYPATIAIILITTLVVSGSKIMLPIKTQISIIPKFCMFMVMLVCSTCLIETFMKKQSKRILGYGIAILINCIYFIIGWNGTTLFGVTEKGMVEALNRILIGYVLLTICLVMYGVIKKEKITFEEYLLKIGHNIAKVGIVYLSLVIGTMLLITVFSVLLLNGDNYNVGNIIYIIQTLLLGGYFLPSMLKAITYMEKDKKEGFTKKMVLYVLLPLVILAFLIVYSYIGQIVLQWEMPRNVISRILIFIFVIGFPVWNMAKVYEEKNWVRRTAIALPIAFAILLPLEIYAIGIRIGDYGITPSRYLVLIFIVLQIVALGFNIYKRGKYVDKILIVFAVTIFITFLTPINYDKVSLWSQKNRMENNINQGQSFSSLTEEQKKVVKGAYTYIQKEDKNFLPSYLSEEQQKEITSYSNVITNPYQPESQFLYLQAEQKNMDITSYQKMTYVKSERIQYSKESSIKLRDKDGIVITEVNLEELAKALIEKQEEGKGVQNEYFKKHNEIELNEQKKLYIANMSVEYKTKGDKITYIEIEGDLFEK